MKIRYYGHIGSLSGYGRAAADNCMALLSTGKVELEISPIDYRPEQARIALAGSREVLVRHCRRQEDLTDPDVVIIHTLPGDLATALHRAYEADPSIDLVPTVAYTTWEGVTAPAEIVRGCIDFDQLWTPSAPSLRALSSADVGSPDVRVIPHAFDPSSLDERRTNRPEVRADFRFYYIGAWNSRKNPAGLLRAWAMAFGPGDAGMAGPSLTLHCPGASTDAFAVALHQTGLSPSDMAPVMFSNQHVAESEIVKMHSVYDCFVTASRGEAWNLPCFDAMLAGRMIIAPLRNGSSDYLAKTSAILVPGMEMPATVDVQVIGSDPSGLRMQTVGAQGLTSRSIWIEPDLVQMAEKMGGIYELRRRDIAVPYDVSRYSYQAVGALAYKALEEL